MRRNRARRRPMKAWTARSRSPEKLPTHSGMRRCKTSARHTLASSVLRLRWDAGSRKAKSTTREKWQWSTRSLCRRIWPVKTRLAGESSSWVSKALLIHCGEPSFEIVGVVGDVANQGSGGYGSGGLRTPIQPQVWVPYTVTGSGLQVLVVRSAAIADGADE